MCAQIGYIKSKIFSVHPLFFVCLFFAFINLKLFTFQMHSVSILLMVLILSFAILRSGADYAACANNCYSTYRQCVGICKVQADCFSCSNSWRNCDAGCRKKRELAANLGTGVYSKKDEKLSEFSLKKATSEKQKRMWNLLFYRRKRTA